MVNRPASADSEPLASALYTPLPVSARASLFDPPRASYLESDAPSTPHGSNTQLSNNASGPLIAAADKPEMNGEAEPKPTRGKRRPLILALIGLVVLAIVVLAVILPVYFTVIKPKQRNSHTNAASPSPSSSSGSTPSGGNGNPKSPTVAATTGGDGSTVMTGDGSTFTYSNKFGGFWVSDQNDPFNNNAQPNSWTPPLNQSWTWGKDRVNGVNLGGLFVLEPFISPLLFQKYPGAVDEWSLSTLMAADTANGGLNQLEDHYNTFITEKDIADIAGAGLNWVRLPIPYWAIEVWPGEPFLAKTSWKYILRIFGWCRKYGIRVNLDLHTIPGSQNGYNHSGKGGKVNFLNGVMGIANAQRALEYIRVLTEFISQPEYKDVVPMFSIVNEALYSTIGQSALTSFYLEAHNMIRGITGLGQGNGPFIAIHDGFQGTAKWANFLPGSDRIALDTHPYFAFDGSSSTDPIDTGTGTGAGGVWPAEACNRWASSMDNSRSGFGVTIAGEFSNGINDCGLFLKGVPGSHTYGGNCDDWQDSTNWSAGTKAGLLEFAKASMDTFGDYFFWTWKVGNSTAGIVQSPLWSYQLGLENGWMPKDPRDAIGACASLGVSGGSFSGNFQPWQTGGAGAGTIAATATANFPWPPPQISNVDSPVNLLPSYTSTGSIVSLPPPTLSPTPTKSVDVGSGWFDSQDTTGAPTPIAGCVYPDPWDAVTAAVPPPCGTAAPTVAPTPVPVPAVVTAT